MKNLMRASKNERKEEKEEGRKEEKEEGREEEKVKKKR